MLRLGIDFCDCLPGKAPLGVGKRKQLATRTHHARAEIDTKLVLELGSRAPFEFAGISYERFAEFGSFASKSVLVRRRRQQ